MCRCSPCDFSLVFEPATIAASMAICSRRRSPTHPLRAVAQRRMAAVRLSCLPRGMGEAEGKKVDPTPLRHRRSRRSRPLARSSHQRPRGSRARQQLGRRLADIMAQTRGRALRANEKKPSRTQGRLQASCPEGSQGRHRTQPSGSMSNATGIGRPGRSTAGRRP